MAYQRKKASKAQQEIILNFMENNPDLHKGVVNDKLTSKDKAKKWEELAELLNAEGSCVKTVYKWQKSWQDLKLEARKRYKNRKKSVVRTVLGPTPQAELDSRILALIGSDVREKPDVKEIIPQQIDKKTKDSQANARLTSSAPAEQTTQSASNSAKASAPTEQTTQSALNPVIQAVTSLSVNTKKDDVPCTSNDHALTFTNSSSHSIIPIAGKRFKVSSASEYSDRTTNGIRFVRNDEVSHDEFAHFAQNIACQLRQLPLDVALQCQSDILTLVQKKRIECLHRRSGKRVAEDQSNSSMPPDVEAYLNAIYD